MATDKKIDVVILGLLSHEDLTGYEIKKRMDSTLRYFWGASFGSIYPALSNLVDRKLAVKRDGSENNRSKIVYSITKSGRDYLKSWLEAPVVKDEIRYETMLKIFFGGEGGPENVLKHIDAFEEKTKEELKKVEEYAEILRTIVAEDENHKYYLLTAEFGIKTYKAYLSWCRDARKMIQ